MFFFEASDDHSPIDAGRSSLPYFPATGVTTGPTSAFPFPPLWYSTLKLYLAAASGSLLCRARAALMMFFRMK
jgi:hypothetical protein